jgi:hypothetical protein
MMAWTAEEHYDHALKLLSQCESDIANDAGLCVGVARVHAELASYRLASEVRCSTEHVARIAECLASNPIDSELYSIGLELRAIVGEP